VKPWVKHPEPDSKMGFDMKTKMKQQLQLFEAWCWLVPGILVILLSAS
jgi:hypothetical protein